MNQEKIYNSKVDIYGGGDKSINHNIVDLIEPGKKILDVGCSTGILGQYIKAHKNGEVYGIDIAEPAIEQASQVLDKAWRIDIEKGDLFFEPESFDIIIFGDILEHLYDPAAVLEKYKAYLKKDGYIILSVPNIANLSNRLSLLRGDFDYTKNGVLDETHIRFFTFKTIAQVVAKAGLQVEQIFGTHSYFKKNYFFLDWLKTILSKQIIIKAKIK